MFCSGGLTGLLRGFDKPQPTRHHGTLLLVSLLIVVQRIQPTQMLWLQRYRFKKGVLQKAALAECLKPQRWYHTSISVGCQTRDTQ